MVMWPLRSSRKKSSTSVRAKTKVGHYHCVELVFPYGANACETAMKLHKRRFLSADAPSIPLAGCIRHCKCRFKHHGDRRHELRRDFHGTSEIYTHFNGQKNRRLGGDRRRNSFSGTPLE